MDSYLEQKLRHLVTAFLAENEKLNLSAMRDEEKCWIGNVLDSMAIVDILPQVEAKMRTKKVNTMIDVGTGGGFPLLPFAIALPQVSCTGLDATGKKLKAIDRLTETLHITNIKTVLGRAEDAGRDPWYREKFDLVTARAVAEIRVLLEFMSPFANVGGVIALWKSLNVEAEIQAAETAEKTLGLKFLHRHTYTLPGDFGTRQLLLYEKISPTTKNYPRPNGEPKKNPL